MPIETKVGQFATAITVSPDSPQHVDDFVMALLSLQSHASEGRIIDTEKLASANGILPMSVESFQATPGRGMGGLIAFARDKKTRAVLFGNQEHIQKANLEIPDLLVKTAQQWTSEGAKVWYGGWDGAVQGIIRLEALKSPN